MADQGITHTAYREQLSSLARYLADNYGGVSYALRLIRDYSANMLPRASSGDQAWDTLADDLFDDWAETADFHGRWGYDGLCEVAVNHICLDGDIGFVMERGAGDVPKLKPIPNWRIASKTITGEPNNFDGITLDEEGTVVGYQVMTGIGSERWIRYAPDQFTLLMDPERCERYRGWSPLRAGLNDIRDAHDIKGMVKLGTKVRSAFAAVIENGALDADDWEDPDEDEAGPPASAGPVPKNVTMAQLFGGEIPVIEGTLKQVGQVGPQAGELDFMDALAGHLFMALGLPPAIVLDTKLTGPNLRAVIAKAQKRFNTTKRILRRFGRWTWVRVISDAIDKGILPPNPRWSRTRFQGPPELGIDIGDMAQADREAVRSGMKTRSRFHEQSGGDWRDEELQSIAEDEFIIQGCQELAKKLGVPVELLLTRRGYTPPAPQQQNGNQQQQ